MFGNIHLLLGMDADVTWQEVLTAYERLMGSLDFGANDSDETSEKQAKIARQKLKDSFEQQETVRNCNQFYQEELQTSTADRQDFCRPKIGELLVAFGLLTLPELDAALEIQSNTRHEHVPLGQLLVGAGYLNQSQLNYYLRLQQLMKLPPDHPERWGQRLLALGLINEDQLKVALIEQQTTNCSLREALINRGWLSAEVLDRIF